MSEASLTLTSTIEIEIYMSRKFCGTLLKASVTWEALYEDLAV